MSDGSVAQADRLTPGSVSRKLLGDLFVRLSLGLWHAREREPAEEGRERHEDEVGVAAKRAEDERERGRHHQVGYPVERLPDARQRVLGVHGHGVGEGDAQHYTLRNHAMLCYAMLG